MADGQPTPPPERRPWYYQTWFLFAAFVLGWPIPFYIFGILWPVWAVLILRSPWHTNTLLNGLGWAMIAVGAVIFAKELAESTGSAVRIGTILIPGLIVMVVTQVMWTKYKLQHGLNTRPPITPTASPPNPDPSPRRAQDRRRLQRRRRDR